jgi:hypothetical protein
MSPPTGSARWIARGYAMTARSPRRAHLLDPSVEVLSDEPQRSVLPTDADRRIRPPLAASYTQARETARRSATSVGFSSLCIE